MNREEQAKQLTQQAYQNGFIGYRVTLKPFQGNEVFSNMIKFCKDNNIFTFDYSIHCFTESVYYGNFCVLFVSKESAEKLQNNFDCFVDYETNFIGLNEINRYKTGDKIQINFCHSLFGIGNIAQGTVYKTENNSLVIKKYRSKTQGYCIQPLTKCILTRLNQFETLKTIMQEMYN